MHLSDCASIGDGGGGGSGSATCPALSRWLRMDTSTSLSHSLECECREPRAQNSAWGVVADQVPLVLKCLLNEWMSNPRRKPRHYGTSNFPKPAQLVSGRGKFETWPDLSAYLLTTAYTSTTLCTRHRAHTVPCTPLHYTHFTDLEAKSLCESQGLSQSL